MNTHLSGYIQHPENIAPFILPACSQIIEGVETHESNVSVISRIAWRYGMRPRAFIAEYLGSKSAIQVSTLKQELAFRYNGYAKGCMDNCDLLRRLTGLPCRKGAYIAWADVLDPAGHGFLSPERHWCPLCYQERFQSSAARQGRHVPAHAWDNLYWSLSFATICLEHKCKLVSHCAKCRSAQPYISNSVGPGYCDNCSEKLSTAPSVYSGDFEVFRQRRRLAPFLVAPDARYSMTVEQLVHNLEAFLAHESGNEHEMVAAMCGFGDDVFRKWRSGVMKPSIESLMALKRALNLDSVLHLFDETSAFLARAEGPVSFALKLKSRPNHQAKIPAIAAHYKAMLEGHAPIESRYKVAERFGVSAGMLWHAFRSELEAIAEMGRQQRKEEKVIVDRDKVNASIRSAILRSLKRGRRLTLAGIASYISYEIQQFVDQKYLRCAIQSQLIWLKTPQGQQALKAYLREVKGKRSRFSLSTNVQ